MNEQPVRADILEKWPLVDEAAADALLRKEIMARPVKLVVLDDDPTGVQTVHDVSVYTDWSLESVRAAFAEWDVVQGSACKEDGSCPNQPIRS